MSSETSQRDPEGSARRALARLTAPESPLMDLARRFESSGRQLLVVGGSVRDAFLGRDHGDIDLCTDARPEETSALVESGAEALWLQGVEYGTVGVLFGGARFEITTFRTESYEPGSRHPQVSFADDITTDLSRRDFTINALAIRLKDLELLDPFGGREDLKAGVIVTPIDPKLSFTDDPLRMLRAFRFSSQLGFGLEKSTLSAITELKELIGSVSAERIRDELTKLLCGQSPGAALVAADSTGIVELFLPELSALKLEQDPVHKHKDVFLHTLAVLEQAPEEEVLRLAALLHDIGKPRTRRIEPSGVSFHHHEVVGARMAADRLKALRYPTRTVAAVAELISLHHRFHTYSLGWSDSAVRRYARDAGPLLADLNELVRADCTTRNRAKAAKLAARMDELEKRIAELAAQEELEKLRPDLDGKQVMAHLGIPPGPLVGQALEHLLELRLERGPLPEGEVYEELDKWAAGRELSR
ncbi:MAG: CCA tRNA nucleotidyltransferase [Actinomycetota bacterium]|nr:CCA tRNA nucleotidyltransferase [Actinomycetota bacterium]